MLKFKYISTYCSGTSYLPRYSITPSNNSFLQFFSENFFAFFAKPRKSKWGKLGLSQLLKLVLFIWSNQHFHHFHSISVSLSLNLTHFFIFCLTIFPPSLASLSFTKACRYTFSFSSSIYLCKCLTNLSQFGTSNLCHRQECHLLYEAESSFYYLFLINIPRHSLSPILCVSKFVNVLLFFLTLRIYRVLYFSFLANSAQSYKACAIVNYTSRVIPDLKIAQIMTLEL